MALLHKLQTFKRLLLAHVLRLHSRPNAAHQFGPALLQRAALRLHLRYQLRVLPAQVLCLLTMP